MTEPHPASTESPLIDGRRPGEANEDELGQEVNDSTQYVRNAASKLLTDGSALYQDITLTQSASQPERFSTHGQNVDIISNTKELTIESCKTGNPLSTNNHGNMGEAVVRTQHFEDLALPPSTAYAPVAGQTRPTTANRLETDHARTSVAHRGCPDDGGAAAQDGSFMDDTSAIAGGRWSCPPPDFPVPAWNTFDSNTQWQTDGFLGESDA